MLQYEFSLCLQGVRFSVSALFPCATCGNPLSGSFSVVKGLVPASQLSHWGGAPRPRRQLGTWRPDPSNTPQRRSRGRSGALHLPPAPHAPEVSCVKEEQLAQHLAQVHDYGGMKKTLAGLPEASCMQV